MPDSKYDVVFTGELFDGFDKADVKANLARVFRVSDEKTEKFFSSPRVVLKANVDRKTADKYKAILAKTGAVVSVEPRQPEGRPTTSAAKKAAPKTPPDKAPPGDGAVAQTPPDLPPADAQNVGPLWGRKVEGGEANPMTAKGGTDAGPSGGYGSLETGIAGDYQFTIGETLSEAWQKVSGNKMTVFVAMLIYIGIMIAFGIAAGLFTTVLTSVAGESGASLGAFLTQFAQIIIAAPLNAGLIMLGAGMAVGAKMRAGSVLSYYDRIVPLAITVILSTILIMIGFILLVIPGIYLSVAYMMALPLVVDKGLGPWQAMEASRKAVTRRWFAAFGLLLILVLLYIAGAIPMLIGLIWVIPLALIAVGILYRNIFGVSSIAAA